MDRFCGKCGNKVVPEAAFCRACGTAVAAGENAPLEQSEPVRAKKPWYKKGWGIAVLTFFGTIILFVSFIIFVGASSREEELPPIAQEQTTGAGVAVAPMQPAAESDVRNNVQTDESLSPGERKYREGEAFYAAQEYNKAAVAYAEAMKLGNADAKFSMSTMYLMGYGVAENKQKSEQLLHEAAEGGSAQALSFLGHRYIYKAYGDVLTNARNDEDFFANVNARIIMHKDYINGMDLIRKAMESKTDHIGYTVMTDVLYFEYPQYDQEGNLIKQNIQKYIDLYKKAGQRGWRYADREIAKLKNLPEVSGSDSSSILIEAYRGDFIKADEKYHGKIVQVSGLVEGIVKDSDGQYCITLWQYSHDREKILLQFYFGSHHAQELAGLEKERKELAKVKKQPYVYIQGKVGKYDGSKLDIIDCRIVPSDVAP